LRVTSDIIKKQVHVCHVTIRWGDMDALRHVNNTVYFRFMEQARIEWLDHVGFVREPDGCGPVVVNAHCSFNKQMTYPGQVEVRTLVGPPGRASFETYHEMRLLEADGRPGELVYAAGGAKIVWVDFTKQKSVPLPQQVLGWLEQ